MLLVLLALVHGGRRVGHDGAGWPASKVPNPVQHPKHCGRDHAGRICDSDHQLTHKGALEMPGRSLQLFLSRSL